MARYVPLTSGFMLTSIVGFLVSVMYVPKVSETWAFTFSIFFVIMFLTAMVNMSQIEAEDRYGLEQLAIHERRHRR